MSFSKQKFQIKYITVKFVDKSHYHESFDNRFRIFCHDRIDTYINNKSVFTLVR